MKCEKKFVGNKFVKTCDEFVFGQMCAANNLVISNHTWYCLLNYYRASS